MDTILSDVRQRTKWDITYMWNLKTNESIYKAETGSQIQETNLW